MKSSNDRLYKVYKHTLPMSLSDKENDMVYIGITCQENVGQRWLNGRGYNRNPHFSNAIQKYGWDNFKHEVLFNGLTKEEAELKEIELIAKYNSTNIHYGYNKTNGGNCNGTMLQETKDKISKANKGNQYGIGHEVSEEARKRISKSMIGNKHGKGQKMSEEHKRRLAESHKTEDFRRKLSEANKSKKHSEETKRKLSESHKGLGSKKVICVETSIIYDSILEASQANNIKGRGHISACCKGTRKTAGGYHWEYYEGVA